MINEIWLTGKSASEYHGTAEYQLFYFASRGLTIPLLDVLFCYFHCTISPPQTYSEKHAIFHCFLENKSNYREKWLYEKHVISHNIPHIPHNLEYKFANQYDFSSVISIKYKEMKINVVPFKWDDINDDNITLQ